MAENTFELRIISPDEVFYEGTADFLEFTSVEGELGVYAKHVPMTTILEPCVMKIHSGEDTKKSAVLGGFVEILKDSITVLAENAEWPDEIDVQRAKDAKKRAEERIRNRSDKTDMARAHTALKRAIARIEATK